MSAIGKQIKRRLPLVGIFLVLLLGVGLFMYPIVSNWYGEYTAQTEIANYDRVIQEIGNKAISDYQIAAEKYNEALAKHDQAVVSSIDYNSLLAVSESIGYIEIPKIDVYLPIFHGLDDSILQRGVGHMEGSSLPVGGKSTHCVLAGHTGLPSAKLFTDLDQLSVGDNIYIHSLDKVLAYSVDQIITVLPYEMDAVDIIDGEDHITLVTCTPYGINSHRLLVRGTRVPYKTQEMEHTDPWPVIHREVQKVPVRTIVWYAGLVVIGSVTLIILIILFMPVFHRKGKGKNKKAKSADDSGETALKQEDEL